VVGDRNSAKALCGEVVQQHHNGKPCASHINAERMLQKQAISKQ